jgi:cyclopropane fatty-acyl-phospholipid synthase-like methyltransferase
MNTMHREFLQKLLEFLPEHAAVLDAACGAGRYFPMLLEGGCHVIGMDQSRGMVVRAKTLFPTVQVENIGLQEMNHQEAFDGVICMDAMEYVFPEDWPVVMRNFHRALKPQGYLYFTLEVADENDIKQAFDRAQQAGLPAVYGEWPDEDVYHYYPSIPQVKEWLCEAGFDLLDEKGGGTWYHHILVCKIS